jgi:hypothetical protein
MISSHASINGSYDGVGSDLSKQDFDRTLHIRHEEPGI